MLFDAGCFEVEVFRVCLGERCHCSGEGPTISAKDRRDVFGRVGFVFCFVRIPI